MENSAVVVIDNPLVLTEDTVWDSSNRYELSSPVIILPGITLQILGDDASRVQISFMTREATISVRTGAFIHMNGVTLDGNDPNTVAFQISNTTSPVELEHFHCMGPFQSCIQLQDNFNSTLTACNVLFQNSTEGIGVLDITDSSDPPREETR